MTIADTKKEQGLLNFFGDAEVVKQFQKLTKPEQMIQFMWKVPHFQNFLKVKTEQVFGKSEGDTRRFREMGNKQFKIGKDREAIKMFNKAITRAPVNDAGKGRDLSLAIANRSAALYKLGFFSLALEDIEFALESGYPKDLRYKLYERKIKIFVDLHDKNSALEIQNKFIEAVNDSTLDKDKIKKLEEEIRKILESAEQNPNSTTKGITEVDNTIVHHKVARPHPDMPFLSADVSIESAPTRGRFAVANRDIPTGSVILVEPAVVNIAKEDQLESFCDFCFKNVDLRLVPCRHCSYVAFCSKECSQASSGSYHKYECGYKDMFSKILDDLYKGKKTDSTKDLVRLGYRALVQKPLSWYKENKETLFAKSSAESYNKTPQHNMLNLVSHHDQMKLETSLWILISSICHLQTLRISGYFGAAKLKPSTSLTEDELFIGGLCFHILELLQFNMHGITEATDHIESQKRAVIKDYENKTRLGGNALYPTFALFNHSCDNNTHKYFAGRTVVVIASKNICKGDEVTEGYFPSVQCIPRPQRRTWLAEHYRFDCQCAACILNLPDLQEISKQYHNFCCLKESCNGIVQETSKCPVCGDTIDVDKNKMEIEKIKETLELLRKKMLSNVDRELSLDNYEKTTETWTRLQKVVRHPYKLLYTAEQLFWKALRLSHGNLAAWN